MNEGVQITLREYLLTSELRVPVNLEVWFWNNSERDAVCVSLHEKGEYPNNSIDRDCFGRTITLQGFGRLVGYNVGRMIPLSYLDLPLIVDLK